MRNFSSLEDIARFYANASASVASLVVASSLFERGRSGDTTKVPVMDIVTGQEYLHIPVHAPTSYLLGTAAVGISVKFADKCCRTVAEKVRQSSE